MALKREGSDRASSKGYIVRWVEAPSNKLLTTVFEASLESATVTLQAKCRQQDTRDSYRAPKSQGTRESRPHWGLTLRRINTEKQQFL